MPHRIDGGGAVLCRKKPSALKKRVRRYTGALLAVLVIMQIYVEVAVKVQLTDVIIAGMKTAAETAVNTAVADFLDENGDVGERLADLHLSEGGTVSAITTDPAYINYVKSAIATRAQENIDRLAREEGLGVPIGSFSGLSFLSAVGPEVHMAVESRSTVACRFKSSFESAGINQTVHHIILVVNVAVTVYNPFRIGDQIMISSDYEIAQTVIVGAVPSYSGVVAY